MRYALILLAFLSACATVGPLDLHDTPTFLLGDLRQKGDGLAEQVKRGEPFIVRVKAGEEVPLKLTLEIPGLTFLPGVNVLRFERDVFVHYGAGKVHVSADGQTWAEMGDFKGMARLFGLGHGGTFQVGTGVTAADGALVSVRVTAK